MENCVINDFFYDIGVGLLTTLISGVFLYSIQLYRYYEKVQRHFHNVTFKSYAKGNPNDPIQEIKCKTKKNVISFEGKSFEGMGRKEPFYGEIVLNIFTLKTGDSFHYHENIDAYGMGKVVIKDENTLFMEFPYVTKRKKDSNSAELIYQSFVWRKSDE